MNGFRKRREKFALALVLPGMILLLIVVFLPFLQNIYYSFTDYSLINVEEKIVGLKNYIDILNGDEFTGALVKSLIYVTLVISLIAIIGIGAAFIQNSKSIKGVTFLQIFLLLPWVMPEVITGYTWKLLLNYETGPYYKLLEALHVIEKGDDIFADPAMALLAVVMANVWRGFPVVAITVYAKLQSLQKEQIEAAVIDGANRFQVFQSIEMPHIANSVISVLTLCFIWTFNSFGLVNVMTGGGPAGATETLPVFLQRKAFKFFDFANASAFAVLMILVLAAVIVLLQGIPALSKKLKNKQ
ncbi:carbohydrate ABC transporter permease [Ruminococcus sp. 5_1_39BFAA]|uniref:carbohydrate ABC transporter permease n=1 Tax=Ruminococcus sp. 5_1_39BFAA TaxID=457412 RepID=UPI003562EF4B